MVVLNIFTGDIKILEREIEDLLKLIENTNTKSPSAYQIAEVMIFFYELLSKKETDYFGTLLRGDYEEILIKGRRMENRKTQNLIATRGEHEQLLTSLNRFFDTIDRFKITEEKQENSPNEKEMYEIISDFFKSRNKNAKHLLDYLIKEKRIFKIPEKEELEKAYNLRNLFQNNFYIFLKSGGNMVTMMTSIVHEIGHTMDEVQLLYLGKRKECNYYDRKSSLIEVISTMYEKEFLDFLLEENIDRKYVEQEIEEYYVSFQFYSEQTELLFYLPDEWLRRDRYKGLAKQDFISYLEENYPIIVEQEVIASPSDMDLSNQLCYCYGFALAVYFSYLRRHDYSRYQENFHNFLKLRAGYFPSDFFGKIGTTPQDLSNIVCEEYEKFSSKRMVK